MSEAKRNEALFRAEAPAGEAEPSGWRWLPLTIVVLILDQLSKAWILRTFEDFERVVVLPVLDITLVYNTGAAFSFLAGASGWQRWFFILLAAGVSIGILIWLRRLRARRDGLLACSLALILGGAVGNVIDRIWLGKVVDFIAVHWGDAYFPAFNIADSAITIGAGLLLIDAWRDSRRQKAGAR